MFGHRVGVLLRHKKAGGNLVRFRAYGQGPMVKGFRAYGQGFRAYGQGFRAYGQGFKAYGQGLPGIIRA